MNKNKDLTTLSFILMMIVVCVITFFVFIILLHTQLFKNINVYMYRGIALLFVSSIFAIILLIVLKNILLKSMTVKDIVSIILVYLSCAMVIFTLIPVTVERAVSVHMLFSIEANDGMTKKEIQDNFIEDYVIENDAFQKRIVEQEVTGSIALDKSDDKYRLTDRGKFIISLFRLTATLFNADIKLMK